MAATRSPNLARTVLDEEKKGIERAVRELQTYSEREKLTTLVIKLFSELKYKVEDIHNKDEKTHGLDLLLELADRVDGVQVKTEDIRTAGAMRNILRDAHERILKVSHSRKPGVRTKIGCLYWITSGEVNRAAFEEYNKYVNRSSQAVPVKLWSGYELANWVLNTDPDLIPALKNADLLRRAIATEKKSAFVAASRLFAQVAIAFAKAGDRAEALRSLQSAERCHAQEPDKQRYFWHSLRFYYRGLKELINAGFIEEKVMLGETPIQPHPLWPSHRRRRWVDLTFVLAQIDQLKNYSFFGGSGLEVCILLQRLGFSSSEPTIQNLLKWIVDELSEEKGCSIDEKCSLCTAGAVSCLLLAGDSQEVLRKPLRWLLRLRKHSYIHRNPRDARIGRYKRSMHYTAAVLEAFLDAYGHKAPKTQAVIQALLIPTFGVGSLLDTWTSYREIPITDVAALVCPALLRFCCAGGEFSPEQRAALTDALKDLTDTLAADSGHLATPGSYYPVRDNISALVLARDLKVSQKLLRPTLRQFRSSADSVFSSKKLRRRLIDSDAMRTARYLNGWLLCHELEFARTRQRADYGHTEVHAANAGSSSRSAKANSSSGVPRN